MASLGNSQSLSIVIPSLNEASNLPLLLADLNRWPYQLEICVCDACSTDLTPLVAELAGAKLLSSQRFAPRDYSHTYSIGFECILGK